MSKTYRGYAEVEDWGWRSARRQHKRKSEVEWRKQAERDIEEMEQNNE